MHKVTPRARRSGSGKAYLRKINQEFAALTQVADITSPPPKVKQSKSITEAIRRMKALQEQRTSVDHLPHPVHVNRTESPTKHVQRRQEESIQPTSDETTDESFSEYETSSSRTMTESTSVPHRDSNRDSNQGERLRARPMSLPNNSLRVPYVPISSPIHAVSAERPTSKSTRFSPEAKPKNIGEKSRYNQMDDSAYYANESRRRFSARMKPSEVSISRDLPSGASTQRSELSRMKVASPKIQSENEIRDILDSSKRGKGYKVVTEKEFAMIARLENKEAELLRHIKNNKVKVDLTRQKVAKVKEAMEAKARKLVNTLMEEMEAAEKRMYDEMAEVSAKILEETHSICESLQRCQALKKNLKESIDQPVDNWTDLKRRSVDVIESQDREDDSIIKSVEEIEIRNDIRWQTLVDDFTRNIRDRIDVVVKFEEIEVQSLSVLAGDDGNAKLQENGRRGTRFGSMRGRRNNQSKDIRKVDVIPKVTSTFGTAKSKLNPQKGLFLMDQVTETRDVTIFDETLNKAIPTRSRADESGEWNGGTSSGSPPRGGTLSGGTPHGGTPRGGTPTNWMSQTIATKSPEEKTNTIGLMVVGFSKEGNVYHYDLQAKLSEGVTDPVTAVNSQWKVANNNDNTRHHVKYPSVVHHPRFNEVYRFGGVLEGKQLKEVEKYNIDTQRWTQLKSGPIARQDAVSLLLNDSNIVTIGGAAKQFNPHVDAKEWKFYDDLSIYNLQTDVWCNMHISSQTQKLTPMNQQRYGFAGLSLMDQNKVVVFGGNGANGRLGTVEMYDYGTNKWMYLENMPISKSRHSVVSYDGQVIVAGGDKKSESQKCFLFDLPQNSWHLMPMLNQKRDRPVLKAYEDKSCVIAAGHGLELKSFEVFDKRMRQQGWMLTTIQDHPLGVGFCAGLLAL